MTHRTTSVAVLGTGMMGAAMARSLLRAGLDVAVWNRTPARAGPLAADGARVTATAAEAVEGADVVLTMVHDAPPSSTPCASPPPGCVPARSGSSPPPSAPTRCPS